MSTKHGRAKNAWNAVLVLGIKQVKGILPRNSFCNCVSMPSRLGKTVSSECQFGYRVLNMGAYPTEKYNLRM